MIIIMKIKSKRKVYKLIMARKMGKMVKMIRVRMLTTLVHPYHWWIRPDQTSCVATTGGTILGSTLKAPVLPISDSNPVSQPGKANSEPPSKS